jgi:hypothetical protein
MSDKESNRKKNYANIQKGKKYFDVFPSGVTYVGPSSNYKGIKSLSPLKKKR